jgi:hypothetical protein
MKTLKYINMGVQGVFIFTAALGLANYVMEKDLFLLAFIALFLGPYQVLVSIVDVIRKGQNSKLLGHLILSAIYLATWGLIAEYGPYSSEDFFFNTVPGQLLCITPPALLATYHWYLTFTRFNPGREVLRPHVFDL